MKIQEPKNKSVTTCRPGEGIDKSDQLIWNHDRGYVVVVSGEVTQSLGALCSPRSVASIEATSAEAQS